MTTTQPDQPIRANVTMTTGSGRETTVVVHLNHGLARGFDDMTTAKRIVAIKWPEATVTGVSRI